MVLHNVFADYITKNSTLIRGNANLSKTSLAANTIPFPTFCLAVLVLERPTLSSRVSSNCIMLQIIIEFWSPLHRMGSWMK